MTADRENKHNNLSFAPATFWLQQIKKAKDEFDALLKRPVRWFSWRTLLNYEAIWAEAKKIKKEDKEELYQKIKDELKDELKNELAHAEKPWWKRIWSFSAWWNDIEYKKRWCFHYEITPVLKEVRACDHKGNVDEIRCYVEALSQKTEKARSFLPSRWRKQINGVVDMMKVFIGWLSNREKSPNKDKKANDQKTIELQESQSHTNKRQLTPQELLAHKSLTVKRTLSKDYYYFGYIKLCAFLGVGSNLLIDDLQKKYAEVESKAIQMLTPKKQQQIQELYGNMLPELKRIYSNQVPKMSPSSSLSEQQSRELSEQTQKRGMEDAKKLIAGLSLSTSQPLVLAKNAVLNSSPNIEEKWADYTTLCGFLGIPFERMPTLTVSDVKHVWREALKILHPDKMLQQSKTVQQYNYQYDPLKLNENEKNNLKERADDRTSAKGRVEFYCERLEALLKNHGCIPEYIFHNPHTREKYDSAKKSAEIGFKIIFVKDEIHALQPIIFRLHKEQLESEHAENKAKLKAEYEAKETVREAKYEKVKAELKEELRTTLKAKWKEVEAGWKVAREVGDEYRQKYYEEWLVEANVSLQEKSKEAREASNVENEKYYEELLTEIKAVLQKIKDEQQAGPANEEAPLQDGLQNNVLDAKPINATINKKPTDEKGWLTNSIFAADQQDATKDLGYSQSKTSNTP